MDLKFNNIESLLKVGEESQLGNSPVVTIVGMKRTVGNFLPVSHDGEGNETYVDKVEGLLGKKDGVRAEFIARKQEGIERRGHINLIRNKINEFVKEDTYKDNKKVKQFIKADDFNKQWKVLFGNECIIPQSLCIACPNCSLFGGWNSNSGKKNFSRVRSFDTYSIQTDDDCIVNDEAINGMKIGNQVAEDSSKATSSNFHYYETVKAGVYFPFIVMIERATLFDVASYLKAIRWADNHGYGKYSARNGKFQTRIWAIGNGHPKFSVLDILEQAKEIDEIKVDNFKELIKFEGNSIYENSEIEELEDKFEGEFKKYFDELIK
ncbi:CRISPR type I-D-associated protein Csc2 [Orenia metallireducens]|uniref:CRISPR type I-D/CYANO-associated protein Csc2 n=1 Tax=Orenia metallireducens TaxID=1413210 RepID=A0A285IAQ1_9FIRM|nr:type I-D CRISPR-associated protein Cas7/Csc2 [Orenia metallireducens]PRX21208.1 CRISPR type I-D-associated protein Csc2 [Orenia metallireducens]SNY44867.1 CRISPR type I-D/CYANO-associated protein Csc2 [Orenia metallireducens]